MSHSRFVSPAFLNDSAPFEAGGHISRGAIVLGAGFARLPTIFHLIPRSLPVQGDTHVVGTNDANVLVVKHLAGSFASNPEDIVCWSRGGVADSNITHLSRVARRSIHYRGRSICRRGMKNPVVGSVFCVSPLPLVEVVLPCAYIMVAFLCFSLTAPALLPFGPWRSSFAILIQCSCCDPTILASCARPLFSGHHRCSTHTPPMPRTNDPCLRLFFLSHRPLACPRGLECSTGCSTPTMAYYSGTFVS